MDSSYSFPKSFQHGCNPVNLITSPVRLYATKLKMLILIMLSLFYNSDTRSQFLSFVNWGYSTGRSILQKQKKHVGKEYHNTTMPRVFEIIERFEKVANTMDYQNNIQSGYKIYPQIEHPDRFLPKFFIYLGNRTRL